MRMDTLEIQNMYRNIAMCMFCMGNVFTMGYNNMYDFLCYKEIYIMNGSGVPHINIV